MGKFGFRISGAGGGVPYSNPKHIRTMRQTSYLHYWYLSMSSHYTYERYTGYAQLNFAAKLFL